MSTYIKHKAWGLKCVIGAYLKFALGKVQSVNEWANSDTEAMTGCHGYSVQ